MKKLLLTLLIAFAVATPAHAKMNVVATLPWIGDLASELGKDKINVKVLVKPSQDPHYVEAKPSMILAARKADIIMYDGLDLEIGYLPLILESSRNPKLMPGKTGNFDCSQFVKVIEKQTTVDRSMGDVHPLGNPHYHFSPSNVLRVADGMARLLAEADLLRGIGIRRVVLRVVVTSVDLDPRPLRDRDRFLAAVARLPVEVVPGHVEEDLLGTVGKERHVLEGLPAHVRVREDAVELDVAVDGHLGVHARVRIVRLDV